MMSLYSPAGIQRPGPSLIRSLASGHSGRDLAVSFSLAIFIYFRLWTELLAYTPADMFFMALPPQPVLYGAAMINTFLAGSLFWCSASLVRRYPSRLGCYLAYAGLLFSTAIGANAVRTIIARNWDFAGGEILRYMGLFPFYVLCGIVVATLIASLALWMRPIVRLIYRTLLLFSPLVVFVFLQGGWAMLHDNSLRFANRPTAPAFPADSGAPRVVWIVFDELDERIAFDDRPRGLRLTEMDRFRAQSVFAANAYSPSGTTAVSLPSLIQGQTIAAYQRDGPASMPVLYAGSANWEQWTAAGSVFSKARALGVNTALIGWYLPYCRLISAGLTRCSWFEMEKKINSGGHTLCELVPNQMRMLLETSVLSPFGQSLVMRHKAAQYQEMLQQAVSAAADRTLGLVLLHLPVPHAPYIYDRRTKTFTLENSPVQGYVDNLALADVSLGEIRQGMQAAGVWNSSTVIVTSDHFNRDAKLFDGKIDRRIPFMVRMPAQTSPVALVERINTVVSKDLITDILTGSVSTPGGVRQWLERRESTGSSTASMAGGRSF